MKQVFFSLTLAASLLACSHLSATEELENRVAQLEAKIAQLEARLDNSAQKPTAQYVCNFMRVVSGKDRKTYRSSHIGKGTTLVEAKHQALNSCYESAQDAECLYEGCEHQE